MPIRPVLFRVAMWLTWATATCVVVVGLVSIWHPLVYRDDDVLLATYATVLAVAIALLVLSTAPWRHLGHGTFHEESSAYWRLDHPAKTFGLVGLFALAFGVIVVVGLGNNIGGNVSFLQIGHHFYETGGDCSSCPMWRIRESTYDSSVRALGLTQSFFFFVGALFLVAVGAPLRRLAER